MQDPYAKLALELFGEVTFDTRARAKAIAFFAKYSAPPTRPAFPPSLQKDNSNAN